MAWAQAALLLGLPFLEVGGQSALRFDVPSLTLHILGADVGIDESILLLMAVVFAAFAFISLTVLYGRIWCGWACPQTVLTDLTVFRDRARGPLRTALALLGVALVSALVSADLIWYFVSPYEFYARLTGHGLGPVLQGFWAVLGLIMFINLAFVRRTFCATVCPYARMQGVLFDGRTLAVGYDAARGEGECMHCDACVRACPVGIDIRKGLQYQCIHCAACADACAGRMGRKGKPSLVGYYFGAPPGFAGGRFALLRPSVVLTAGVAAVFLGMFLWLSGTREPLDVNVYADAGFAPRASEGGREITNAFVLEIKSRAREEIEVSVDVEGAVRVQVMPAGPHVISPGGSARLVVYVTMPAVDAGGEITMRVHAPAMGQALERVMRLRAPAPA